VRTVGALHQLLLAPALSRGAVWPYVWGYAAHRTTAAHRQPRLDSQRVDRYLGDPRRRRQRRRGSLPPKVRAQAQPPAASLLSPCVRYATCWLRRWRSCVHGECSLLKMKPDAVFFLGDGTRRHAFDTRRCAAAGLHRGRVCAQVAGILEASSRPQVSQSARPLTMCGASRVAPHALIAGWSAPLLSPRCG
jgi:hypothetical protein